MTMPPPEPNADTARQGANETARVKPGDGSEPGIVLIAHGSRRQQANEDLFELAERFRGRGYRHVVASFLELAEPAIVEAGVRCADAGANPIILVPYFLSAGRHVTSDLDRARTELARRFPGTEVRLTPPLGPHPLLDEIVEQRIRESPGPGPETTDAT